MNPTNTKSRKDLRERHSSLNKKKSVMMMNMPMQKSNFPLTQKEEEYSPYPVDQSSSHPMMQQKSFLSPNIWKTHSESTKQMIIEHNKKIKLNNPTPYPSGSRLILKLHWVSLTLPHNKFINIHSMNLQVNPSTKHHQSP